MNNLDNISNIQDKTRKHGITLLLITIGFSLISIIGIFWYSLARGCGYEHSFFLCTGAPLLLYLFLFINLILSILAILQIIKPFFGEKMIKCTLLIFVCMIFSVIIFDFVAQKIDSTARGCSIVGLYDEKSSENCYNKLAQTTSNLSYCDKSGANLGLCKRDVALGNGDYSICPSGEYYDQCVSTIAMRKLDVNGCGLAQVNNTKNSCIKYVNEKLTTR